MVTGYIGTLVAWVAWVNFLRGLRGLRGSKYFLRGSTFYVGCVGQNFLRGSISFTWVKIFCLSQFFVGSNFFAWIIFLRRMSLKQILIGSLLLVLRES